MGTERRARARPRLRRRRAAPLAVAGTRGAGLRRRDRGRSRARLRRERRQRAPGRPGERAIAVRRRLVRLRGALGNAPDHPPHRVPAARDAARRPRGHRHLAQLRTLAGAIADRDGPHAGVRDAPVRVVRNAQRAPLHHQRLRGPVPAHRHPDPRAARAPRRKAGDVPAESAWQPGCLSLHAGLNDQGDPRRARPDGDHRRHARRRHRAHVAAREPAVERAQGPAAPAWRRTPCCAVRERLAAAASLGGGGLGALLRVGRIASHARGRGVLFAHELYHGRLWRHSPEGTVAPARSARGRGRRADARLVHRRAGRRARQDLPSGRVTRSQLIAALQLSFRAAAGAAISYAVARQLGLEFPIYAMIAAVIVTDLVPAETRKLALRRLAGTIVGSVLGAMLAAVLPHGALTIGFGIFLAMFLSHLLRVPEAARIAGYLCAIVLLEHTAAPWEYAMWRFIETVLGLGVALLISLIPRLIRHGEST